MLVLLLAGISLAVGGRPEPNSSRESATEYRIKAAILYNFIRYTTWPDNAFEDDRAPIELLVVGKDPFGEVLDKTFAGKEIHGRKVEIQRAPKLPPHSKAHLVYCALPRGKDMVSLLRQLDKQPTLVMGESEGFAENGATGNFYVEDKKVRFEVNTDAIKRSGLTIGVGLLKLAKIVRTKEEK